MVHGFRLAVADDQGAVLDCIVVPVQLIPRVSPCEAYHALRIKHACIAARGLAHAHVGPVREEDAEGEGFAQV